MAKLDEAGNQHFLRSPQFYSHSMKNLILSFMSDIGSEISRKTPEVHMLGLFR